MATKTQLANRAFLRVGADTVTDIDADTSTKAAKALIAMAEARDELQASGPEHGWRWLRKRYYGIDVNETDITAFSDYSGTVTGAVSVTSASHGLVTGDLVTIEDTTNYDGDYEVVYIDANTFYIITTWVADDATGTARWVSEEYIYRYAIPSSPVNLRVDEVRVGGVEITDWQEEGGWILTNQESDEIDIVYIKQDTTESNWPVQFCSAYVMLLAAKLALGLTKDDALHDRIMNEYLSITLPKAIAIDERNKYVREESSAWTSIGRTTTTLE